MIPWESLTSFEFLSLIVLIAAAFSISTIPIITIILILLSAQNPIRKSIAFLIGRFTGIVLLSSLTYYIMSKLTSPQDERSAIVALSFLELILGAVFVLIGIKLWNQRKYENEDIKIPKIFRSIDNLNVPKAFLVGFAALFFSVKNWFLIAITVNAFLKVNLRIEVELAVLALFLFISSITIIIPLAVNLIFGYRIQPTLVKLKFWMIKNTNSVISIVMFIAGGLMLFSAIFG